MLDGYLFLHRELLEKPIWLNSTPEQRTVLIVIMVLANHKQNSWEWKGQKFNVEAGQFITSLDCILKYCGKKVTIQNVRTAINRFKKLGFLTNESTKQGRLITIVNWKVYQQDAKKTNKEINNELTNDQQTPNNQLTPNKNDKNDKNDKNIKKTIQKKDFNSLVSEFTTNTEVEKAVLDFIEMRTAIKKPLTTSRALNGLLNKLKPHSDTDKIKLLDEAIEKNWLSVYPRENERSIKQLD